MMQYVISKAEAFRGICLLWLQTRMLHLGRLPIKWCETDTVLILTPRLNDHFIPRAGSITGEDRMMVWKRRNGFHLEAGKKQHPPVNKRGWTHGIKIWPPQLQGEVVFWGLNSALIKKRVTCGDEKSRTGNWCCEWDTRKSWATCMCNTFLAFLPPPPLELIDRRD